MHKRGTPTMGGIVIILAVIAGYGASHLRLQVHDDGIGWAGREFQSAGLLAVGAIVGMGIVGFIDDYQKLSRFRNRGLGIAAKFIGQLAVAGVFAWGAVASGASTSIGFSRPTSLDLGAGLFAVWVLLMLTGVRKRGQLHRRLGRFGVGIERAGCRRLHDHRLLDVPASRSLPGRGKPGTGFRGGSHVGCIARVPVGGTPYRPGSSWAMSGLRRSVGVWRPSPCSPIPTCSW